MTNRWAPLVREERASLLGFLSGIDGNAWERPTACAEWSVKDVLAHLVDLEVRLGRAYRGELSGLTPEQVEEENLAGVRRWRVLPGEVLRGAFWQHGTAAQRIIDVLGDEEWSRSTAFGAATELRHVIAMHFKELAVHGHDITSALEAPPLWEERVADLIELLVTTDLRTEAAPREGSVLIDVESAGRRGLSATPPGWKIVPDDDDIAATVVTSPVTFVLATTGRISASDAAARSKVAGDRALVERVLSPRRAV